MFHVYHQLNTVKDSEISFSTLSQNKLDKFFPLFLIDCNFEIINLILMSLTKKRIMGELLERLDEILIFF